MTLDEFLASVREDIVYPSNGDGTYSSPKPCATCGSYAFELLDTPVCVVCSKRVGDMHVNVELLHQALDALLLDVRFLPEQEQRTLAVAALIANVQLQKILAALA